VHDLPFLTAATRLRNWGANACLGVVFHAGTTAARTAAKMARIAYPIASDIGKISGVTEPTSTIAARPTAAMIGTDTTAPRRAPVALAITASNVVTREDFGRSGTERLDQSDLAAAPNSEKQQRRRHRYERRYARRPYFSVFSGARKRDSPLTPTLDTRSRSPLSAAD